MANVKRISFEDVSGGSWEVMFLDSEHEELLDDSDGAWKEAPSDIKIAVPEHLIANGFFYDLPGTFMLEEQRSDWGTRNTVWKANQVGSAIVEHSGSLNTMLDVVAATLTPATVSDIGICNNALLSLGGNVITSFADGSAEAVLCSNFWYPTMKSLMRLHPWNCAIKRAALTPDVTPPAYEWTYAFTLPADLLRILDLDGVTEYKVEGRKILCNESALNLRYVYLGTSETWDSLLVEAMTAYMAFKLAYPVTKSNTTRGEQWKTFTELLRTAKAVDAQEEPGDTMGDFPFINARGR